MQNLILTGLPRSGLTVVSALLDGLPQSVTLNEPVWQAHKLRDIAEPVPYCKWLVGDYIWQRRRLLTETPVRDFRDKDGQALLDGVHDARSLRGPTDEMEPIHFARPGLHNDFTLTIKQHALYTSLLPTLVKFDFFKIVVVLRHPFDVIQSWQKQKDKPLEKGKLAINAGWWPEVESLNIQEIPTLERMVRLYDTFCQRYYDLRDDITVIKFEDVVKTPTLASVMIGADVPSPNMTRIEQRTRILNKEQTEEIRELLKERGVFTKYFYDI